VDLLGFVFCERTPECYGLHHFGVHVELHGVFAVLVAERHQLEPLGAEGRLSSDCHVGCEDLTGKLWWDSA
jgi:hypothetical protein